MTQQSRKTGWLVIIVVAILLHLVLFLSVRPDFFSMFKKSVSTASDQSAAFSGTPDAIITIPIEIVDTESENEPINIEDEPVEPKKEQTPQQEAPTDSEVPGEGDNIAVDLDNLLGESPQTLPGNPGPETVNIPPRPVEITWPDTRDLKHCLGHHIDVRIEVDDRGNILRVEPPNTTHPADCIDAALASARRIVFEPGRVDGVPTTMWTQVRIEFRRKR